MDYFSLLLANHGKSLSLSILYIGTSRIPTSKGTLPNLPSWDIPHFWMDTNLWGFGKQTVCLLRANVEDTCKLSFQKKKHFSAVCLNPVHAISDTPQTKPWCSICSLHGDEQGCHKVYRAIDMFFCRVCIYIYLYIHCIYMNILIYIYIHYTSVNISIYS